MRPAWRQSKLFVTNHCLSLQKIITWTTQLSDEILESGNDHLSDSEVYEPYEWKRTFFDWRVWQLLSFTRFFQKNKYNICTWIAWQTSHTGYPIAMIRISIFEVDLIPILSKELFSSFFSSPVRNSHLALSDFSNIVVLLKFYLRNRIDKKSFFSPTSHVFILFLISQLSYEILCSYLVNFIHHHTEWFRMTFRILWVLWFWTCNWKKNANMSWSKNISVLFIHF